jgi:hypothetical protein
MVSLITIHVHRNSEATLHISMQASLFLSSDCPLIHRNPLHTLCCVFLMHRLILVCTKLHAGVVRSLDTPHSVGNSLETSSLRPLLALTNCLCHIPRTEWAKCSFERIQQASPLFCNILDHSASHSSTASTGEDKVGRQISLRQAHCAMKSCCNIDACISFKMQTCKTMKPIAVLDSCSWILLLQLCLKLVWP